MSRIERSNEKYNRAAQERAKVEDSCGCVFCDIGLRPEKRNGQMMHHRDRCDDWVPCTKATKKS